ncbi:MAG TPA: helix-turn-helix domain-containing protein [Solirubrobacteraceae bacterium]|jgi:hypothetical protein|nr:helix-turn-helix domain-containing protein [Solirubrobacteraceae bacterium]
MAGLATDARAAVAQRLRARIEELADAVLARVRGAGFDRTGDEDAQYRAGLRGAVAAAIEYGLCGIECGHGDPGPVPASLAEQARRAARLSVPLDTVLRRYVVGSAVLAEFVLEEGSRGELPGEREALREALRAQASVLDHVLQTVTSEYSEELETTKHSPERRRRERVHKLLTGATLEQSQLMGYDLAGWHLGVIAVGRGAEHLVGKLAAAVDRQALSVLQGESTVWAWLGANEHFAFANLERVFTGAVPPEDTMLALGEVAPGLHGWRLTHQQAQAALAVALRRPRALTRYADVALLAAALKDEALAQALMQVFVRPLDRSRNGGRVLRQTLRAYLEAERSVSSASAALGVARKTIENRLRTIEERLNRTLHPCPPELEVALELDELNSKLGSPQVGLLTTLPTDEHRPSQGEIA